MSHRSAQFATFTVERDIAFPPAAVFRAFADIDAKRRWFGDPASTDTQHTIDFRVGGLEHSSGGSPEAGGWYTYDATYQDIVPDQRIVYTYAMTIDGNRISASVATIELAPRDAGTHLRLTEQGVFLDGFDTNAAREHGTNELIDALAASLEPAVTGAAR